MCSVFECCLEIFCLHSLPYRHSSPNASVVSVGLSTLVPSCLGSQLPWFPAALVPSCLGSQLPWFPAALVPSCLGSQLFWVPAALVPSCLCYFITLLIHLVMGVLVHNLASYPSSVYLSAGGIWSSCVPFWVRSTFYSSLTCSRLLV